MSCRKPVGTGGSKDVYSIVLVQTKLPVPSADLQDQFLVVVEAHVIVSAELEICPFLVNLLLLTINYLLVLLRLLVSLVQLPGADSLCIAKLLRASFDDVKDSDNVLRGAVLELVDRQRMSSRDRLSIYMLVSRSLETEGGLVNDPGLHRGMFKRHLGRFVGKVEQAERGCLGTAKREGKKSSWRSVGTKRCRRVFRRCLWGQSWRWRWSFVEAWGNRHCLGSSTEQESRGRAASAR